jgi:hypothetical protein
MLSYIPERNPGLVNSVKKHSMIPAFFVDIWSRILTKSSTLSQY